MFDPRGSTWRKWDLHVHTPASLVQHFPGAGDDPWEDYISDLEALPEDFQVLGINDYFFVDGYERLLREKENGRLANVDLLLPVVELRLNQFGGSRHSLSRVNAHVIFSEEVSPEVIRDQFLRALGTHFQLTPRAEGAGLEWSGAVTRASLEEFGEAIVASVPESEQYQFGSALMEGFGNLTVSLDDICALLQRSYFDGRALLGIGKTEWADVKWADGSIADKKNIINRADLVFTAAESPAAYHRGRASLKEQGVNDRLLDCSDAHYPSNSTEKDRVGNCSTWLKASPTFGGLRQALQEFGQRVFVGAEPPQLSRVREHPGRYIVSAEIRPAPGVLPTSTWFDVELPLNAGLVAIIGNRGSGKSALAEAIALAGATTREKDFSFLTTSKFREPRLNPARQFLAQLEWADGELSERRLADSVEPGTVERVQHLPQQYLEKLCNEVPRGDKTDFDRELERIIFSHLGEEDRMGAGTLEERVEIGNRARNAKLKAARASLKTVNSRIAKRERLLRPEEVRSRLDEYRNARKEWWQAKAAPPPPVPEPDGDDPARRAILFRIDELVRAEAHLSDRLEDVRSGLGEARRLAAELQGFRSELNELAGTHAGLLEANGGLLAAAGLTTGVSTLTIDEAALDTAASRVASTGRTLAAQLDETDPRGLPAAVKFANEEAARLRGDLTAPDEQYQVYLGAHRRWESEIREMLGDSSDPDSLHGKRARWQTLARLPTMLQEDRDERAALCAQIHSVLLEEASDYGALYAPLEEHMSAAPIGPEYQLTVDTALVDTGFSDQFLEDRINRHVAGSFCGKEVSLQSVTSLLETADFNDTDSVLEFVAAIDERLHADHRETPHVAVDPGSQMRKGHTVEEVYDFIHGLDYLSPRFALRFGSRPIHLLSPGEKGVLLLIFFLLAETSTRPLIIDQPEDNLDNQTVFRALVSCFHHAKTRRQVIIVTHNPNLAVVCDADQVVVADIDKEADNDVSYVSGPIEDPEMSMAILNVLEGTRPAFSNRSAKYDLHAPANRAAP